MRARLAHTGWKVWALVGRTSALLALSLLRRLANRTRHQHGTELQAKLSVCQGLTTSHNPRAWELGHWTHCTSSFLHHLAASPKRPAGTQWPARTTLWCAGRRPGPPMQTVPLSQTQSRDEGKHISALTVRWTERVKTAAVTQPLRKGLRESKAKERKKENVRVGESTATWKDSCFHFSKRRLLCSWEGFSSFGPLFPSLFETLFLRLT